MYYTHFFSTKINSANKGRRGGTPFTDRFERESRDVRRLRAGHCAQFKRGPKIFRKGTKRGPDFEQKGDSVKWITKERLLCVLKPKMEKRGP